MLLSCQISLHEDRHIATNNYFIIIRELIISSNAGLYVQHHLSFKGTGRNVYFKAVTFPIHVNGLVWYNIYHFSSDNINSFYFRELPWVCHPRNLRLVKVCSYGFIFRAKPHLLLDINSCKVDLMIAAYPVFISSEMCSKYGLVELCRGNKALDITEHRKAFLTNRSRQNC